MEEITDRVSTADRRISAEQQAVIDSIPMGRWRGILKPVPDLAHIARKLHYYAYGPKELALMKAEIEAWKEMQAKLE